MATLLRGEGIREMKGKERTAVHIKGENERKKSRKNTRRDQATIKAVQTTHTTRKCTKLIRSTDKIGELRALHYSNVPTIVQTGPCPSKRAVGLL